MLARTTAGTTVRTTALRAFGITTLGVAVLVGTLIAAVAPGVSGIAMALAIAGVLVAVGVLSLRGASGEKRRAERESRKKHQAAILDLAERSGGIVTVTEVARALGLSLEDAEAELNAMVDGLRVNMEVSPEGLVRYEFRELVASTFPMNFRVEDLRGDETVESTDDAVDTRAKSSTKPR